MFESLIETVRTFSFQSVLKGNILSSPGTFGNSGAGLNGAKSNSPASNLVSNRYLSTYYKKMQEFKDYENNALTSTIIGIYIDFIKGYFNKSGDLISISEDVNDSKKIATRMNQISVDLDIVTEVKEHLWDIIFDGAFCFKTAFDPENRRYVKFYLQNPHNVVTIKKGKLQTSHLVVSKKGVIFEVKAESIFRLGQLNMTVINDVNTDFYKKETEDTLIKDDTMMVGLPLYYYIGGKVKEYLLKEQILSLLSIKDLVQPLLLLVHLDKNSTPSEGNKLALSIENMINKYSDISSILSSNFSINGLIDSMMNNIRVIPDYGSAVGNMNNIDMSKITNKINDIENSQENKKESILTDASIPKSLFNGESTKWDAIKSSQRLNSKISGICSSIDESIKVGLQQLYYHETGVLIDTKDIKTNLFNKTDVDFNVAVTNAEIISGLTQTIQQALSSVQQTIQEVKLIDPEQFAKYTLNQLKLIDPEVGNFVTEDTIKQAIEFINQQQSQDQSQ